MPFYVRHSLNVKFGRTKMGPKKADHPSVNAPCPACERPIQIGELTTLVPLGPGDDVEAQAQCLQGHFYNAVAVEVHWACATGEPS